jgi:putative chitinase
MVLTLEQVKLLLPGNTQCDGWLVALNNNLLNFDINSPLRIAAFISQTAHESNSYNTLKENLNYKADQLIRVWPKRFNTANVEEYAHNPEKIANFTYANRNGNGDVASGDGWKFKGRGPIQVTGRENYSQCSQAVYGDDRLLHTPELLETDKDAAVKSACWFWNSKNLNSLADEGDIKKITLRINGGYVGLDDRIARYNSALSILQG